jgi:hypothetical protein
VVGIGVLVVGPELLLEQAGSVSTASATSAARTVGLEAKRGTAVPHW